MKERELRNVDCIDLLYDTAISLTSARQPESLYQAIVDKGCLLTNTDHGFLYVVSEKDELLELKYGSGIYSVYKGAHRTKDEPSVSSTVWRTGRPLSVESLSTWQGHAVDRPYGWDVIQSVLGIPLYAGIEVIGVVGLGFASKHRRFTAAETDLLSRFAALASLAFYNAKLYQHLPLEKRPSEAEAPLASALFPAFTPPADPMPPQGTETDPLNPGRLAREIWKSAQFQSVDAHKEKAAAKAKKKLVPATIDPHTLVLTKREKIVLNMLADGASNQEIAERLSLAIPTIKAHISHIFFKLGVKRRVQAVIVARQKGLL